MLDDGVCLTIDELARRERADDGYMSRVLGLTLLAPEIVNVILYGRQRPKVMLAQLLEPFAVEWENQRSELTGMS